MPREVGAAVRWLREADAGDRGSVLGAFGRAAPGSADALHAVPPQLPSRGARASRLRGCSGRSGGAAADRRLEAEPLHGARG